MTKASGGKTGTNGGTPVQSPAKAAGPGKKFSPSPKKENEGKKGDIKKIVIVSNPDATPFGWAFHGFFDAKEFLKSLSNTNGEITHFGNEVYRPFSNLTTRWVKTSVFNNLIWVIRIDKEMDGEDNCFPLLNEKAHAAYGNKIARGVIQENVFGANEIVVVKATLTETEATDLEEHISPVYNEVRDAIFHEAIKAMDSDVEDLI
jgi:hypothetical protein